MDLISKYGTYLAIAAAAITAALQAFGIMIPDFVYTIEGAVGVAAFRTTVSVAGAGPGWKSYVVALAAAGIAAFQAYTGIMVPEWVFAGVAAIGLGTLHVAVQKV